MIHRPFGGVHCYRRISDRATRVVVHAFPMSQLSKVAASGYLNSAGAYAMTDGKTAYIGETRRPSRRLSEHAADPAKEFARDVFVIGGCEGAGFDKLLVVDLQYRLTRLALAAGVVNVWKAANPPEPDLTDAERATHDRIATDAMRMLVDAGCRIFEPAVQPPTLAREPASVDEAMTDDVADAADSEPMAIGVSTVPIGSEEFELRYSDLFRPGLLGVGTVRRERRLRGKIGDQRQRGIADEVAPRGSGTGGRAGDDSRRDRPPSPHGGYQLPVDVDRGESRRRRSFRGQVGAARPIAGHAAYLAHVRLTSRRSASALRVSPVRRSTFNTFSPSRCVASKRTRVRLDNPFRTNSIGARPAPGAKEVAHLKQNTEDRETDKPARKTSSKLGAGSADAHSDQPEFEEDDGEVRTVHRPAWLPKSPTELVVGATFDASVPRKLRRRLMGGKALAVIVIVPATTWVKPVAAYVRSTFGNQWRLQARDESDRKRDAAASAEVALDLSKGLCVMGVTVDEKLLPTALRSAADIVIRLAPPDGCALRKAISGFARRSPGKLDRGIAAGLELAEIVAAFRPGQGPGAIVRRLDAARRSHDEPIERVPDLATAVEYGEARTWAMDLAKDIADFKDSKLDWRHLNRGICLHSRNPGLGKSLFSKVVAQACGNAPLISTSAGDWFSHGSGHLHTVVQHFREAVSKANALAAPIAFLAIEEVDAAVPDRSTLSHHARDYFNILVSDILTTFDSTLASDSRIILLASTNQIDRVDPALLRPGRLEKIVEIPLPDAAGALNILSFHLDGEIQDDLSSLGPLLAGRTGADIMYLVRSARRAARHAGRSLTLADIERAVLPIEHIPAARLFRMSVHESAHAVAAVALRIGKVRHVVLQDREDASGETTVDFLDDDLPTRADLEDRIVATLAARTAERLFTGNVSVGSGGHLE